MKKQNRLLSIALIIACFTACKKDVEIAAPIMQIDSVATYKIIITGLWKAPAHTVPPGNHFTTFVGMVHNSGSYIFQLDKLAGKGLEDVAEVGSNNALLNEIAGYVSGGNALHNFMISIPGITGTDSAIIRVTSKNALISFASMIAPSPDWFAGLDSYNLIQKDAWVKDVSVQVAGYDAGTENGDVFGYDNPETVPQQKVTYLSPANASVIANNNAVIAPFVSVRLIKQ